MIPNLFPRTRAVVMALALAALAACTAPAPSTADTPAADATADLRADEVAAATPPAQPAPEAATTPSPAPLKKRMTGGPLPPERISDQPKAPDQPGAPPEIRVDTSCRTDADCAVKDVGNCCGHYPACVNVDSPTDPKGVQARCAKQGMASVCGFPQISGCTCVEGNCQASGDGVEEAVR